MEDKRIYLLETLRALDYRIIDHASDSEELARLEEQREQLRQELHAVLTHRTAA